MSESGLTGFSRLKNDGNPAHGNPAQKDLNRSEQSEYDSRILET